MSHWESTFQQADVPQAQRPAEMASNQSHPQSQFHGQDMNELLLAEKCLQEDLLRLGVDVTSPDRNAASSPDMFGSLAVQSDISMGFQQHVGSYNASDTQHAGFSNMGDSSHHPLDISNSALLRSKQTSSLANRMNSSPAGPRSRSPSQYSAFTMLQSTQRERSTNHRPFARVRYHNSDTLEAEDQEEQPYTMRTLKLTPEEEAALYARNVRWRQKVERKLEGLRRVNRENEVTECTFHPRVHNWERAAQPASPEPCPSLTSKMNVGTSMTSLATQGDSSAISGQWGTESDVTAPVQPENTAAHGATCFERLHCDGMERIARLETRRQNEDLAWKRKRLPNSARPLSRHIYHPSTLLGTHEQPAPRTNLRAMEDTYSDPNLFPTFQPDTYFTSGSQLWRSKSVGATSGRQYGDTAWQHRSSAESFQEFWNRQLMHLDERAAKVMHIQQDMHADLHQQPQMSPGSRRLIAQKNYNESMEFMHVSLESSAQPYEDNPALADSLVRPGRTTQRQSSYSKEFGTFSELENCTFRPAIRPSSAARSPRSWAAMSAGDCMRKEHSLERTRRQQEELHLATHTFTPTLYKPPNKLASVSGRLMSTDPSFTTRIMHKLQVRASKAQQARYEREAKEMEECTFKPATGRMPKLIQRLMHD